jgi:hypothetical protein
MVHMLTVHLYDPNDFFWRKYFPKRSQPGIVFTSVSNLRDIQSELRRIGGLGGKIDVLWIHSHGSPGVVVIPKTGLFSGNVCLNASNVSELAPLCRLAIAAQARIYFAGCVIGYGARGEAFLRAAGPQMLGHGGGVMLAPTSITYSHPILGDWLPHWGSVRAAKVSPGGTVAISTVSP